MSERTYHTCMALIVAMMIGLACTPTLSPLAMQAQGMAQGLDAFARVVDPLYEASVLGCDHAEGMVVLRSASRERDTASMHEIRTQCDRIFAAFQAAESAHEAAKDAVELAQREPDVASLELAQEALEKLAQAAGSAQKVWAESEDAIRRATQ